MTGDANYALLFIAPNGKQIKWENVGDLRAMVLDFDGDTPYLAAHPALVSHYRDYGCPEPAYVFLKYDGGRWTRIKYEEFPAQLTNSNLLLSSKPDYRERSGKFLSKELIRERNNSLDNEFHSIDPSAHSPVCTTASKYNNMHPYGR